MQIDILKASKSDLEAILQLQKECYMSEAEIITIIIFYHYNRIEIIGKWIWKLYDFKCIINGEIVGSVRGFVEDETSYIGRLIVKNDFQNKGIGRQLLDSIESTFKDCNRFELFTGHKSQKNLYLYKKLGYKEFKQEMVNKNLTIIYLEKTK